jgi:hypothetical protein
VTRAAELGGRRSTLVVSPFPARPTGRTQRAGTEQSLRCTAKEAKMQPNPNGTNAIRFAGYLSEHRFRLMVLASALALAVTLAAVYGTTGFGPIWADFAVPVPAG